jgi:two-component system response regulator ChvI
MDKERHNCTWKNISVKLTVTEFIVLQALVKRPGMVRSRHELLENAYGDNMDVDPEAIASHMKRLRQKIRGVDAHFDQIETIYKLGYRWKG